MVLRFGSHLEDNEVLIGGPHEVGLVRRLLDVLRGERVAPLVEVLAEKSVQPLQRLQTIRQALFKTIFTRIYLRFHYIAYT